MYEAIILAGGFGTRLREAVPDLPKPMAPVAGKPFLEWQIEYLISLGVSSFILSVGYKAEAIRSYFGSEWHNAKITYAWEDKPLGTGGAIKYALQFASQKRVFVFNGDSICNLDLSLVRSRVKNTSTSIVMCTKHVVDTSRYGAVQIEPEVHLITQFGEKSKQGPGLINAGIYDVPASLFNKLSVAENFSFETEVLQHRINNDLYAANVGDFFIDIGIPEDLTRAQTEIPQWRL